MGEMVEFPSNGSSASGYLARPSSGTGNRVIVIQEWWGLVDHIKDVCDRLAVEGFMALAPDLYHGKTTAEPDEAGKTMMAMEIEQAARDMSGAVDFMLNAPGGTGEGVGVIGFCMGGGLALFLAALRPEVTAVVPFYGVGPAVEKADLSKVRANVLGHWGEKDHSYDHARIDQLEAALKQAGVGVEMHWYDADHAFCNDTRPEVYNPDAAQLAWDRTLAFLRLNLVTR
jgi:carboxymethylenebutenolidase